MGLLCSEMALMSYRSQNPAGLGILLREDWIGLGSLQRCSTPTALRPFPC